MDDFKIAGIRHDETESLKSAVRYSIRLQTTQPTSGGAVTVVSSCCANCVEPARLWGPDLPFFGHAGHADPLDGWRCCSQKAGDVETNPRSDNFKQESLDL